MKLYRIISTSYNSQSHSQQIRLKQDKVSQVRAWAWAPCASNARACVSGPVLAVIFVALPLALARVRIDLVTIPHSTTPPASRTWRTRKRRRARKQPRLRKASSWSQMRSHHGAAHRHSLSCEQPCRRSRPATRGKPDESCHEPTTKKLYKNIWTV